MKHTKKAFTLIEVLLVIVIIAILAGIVIIAVNPARQISQANNSQRTSDIKALVTAVHEYAIDNRGVLPATITATPTEVGMGTGEIDLCALLVPDYIAAMPADPTDTDAVYTSCTTYHTGYNISVDADGRITTSAPSAELSETISLTQ